MNNFKGWNSVFRFTFRQATKNKGFRIVTALIAIAIIATIILVSILNAKPKEETKPLVVKSVYVLDESGLKPVDFVTWMPQVSDERFKDVLFVNIEGMTKEELVSHASSQSDEALPVHIYKKDAGYVLEVLIPKESSISESDAEKLIEPISACFEMNKLGQAGLSSDQLNQALLPVTTSYSEVGEDTSIFAMLVKMVAPMIFGLTLYMMLLLHGQTISKEVSTEKTSKLIEMLLISVHPYALLTGKILAISTMALMQFAIWIAAIVAGLYGGNSIAHMIYPSYNNSVIEMIGFFKDNIGEGALSMSAIMLAILIFCIGFLFYCVLAGLAGSMVSRSEDVATTQMLFQFPIIISFLVCYMAPLLEKDVIMTVARYVPFTIPFCIPIELLTGSVSLLQGGISAMILLVFSLLIIMLSAKIYKGAVLYSGQKFTWKTIGNILKADR
jgi:ABC-2 type transport system permease protein